MIRYIQGTVINQTEHGVVVLTGGLGYLVFTPNSVQVLPHDTIALHTHQAVRETALDLYGFPNEADLTLFELLLTIPKIGPKSALQIMNQAQLSLIYEAVSLADPTHLTKLAGMGKKTAEKIVTALQNKIPEGYTKINAIVSTRPDYHDAFDTLITLGYDPGAIKQVLDELEDGALSTSTLVKIALQKL